MANSVCEVLLTEAPLKMVSADVDSNTGAIVDFWGVVRELEDSRKIDGIDYEANETMALHQLRLVAEGSVEKFQLINVVVHHRIGFVPTGETSLFVQVRAQHRQAGFDASKWIVDELKKTVPIWKRPRFTIDHQCRAESSIPAITK